jgi:hypothetical protein
MHSRQLGQSSQTIIDKACIFDEHCEWSGSVLGAGESFVLYATSGMAAKPYFIMLTLEVNEFFQVLKCFIFMA